MVRLDIDPGTFTAASALLGSDVANGLSGAYSTLLDGLAGSTGMAGTDPGGSQWGASYDQAAADVSGVTQDVINGCYQLAALLEATGFNHGTANSAATPGGVVTTTDSTGYAEESISLPTPWSAAGGSGSAPTGWGLIEHLVGYVWPNGHQDKLRTAAAAWSSGSRAVTAAGYSVDSAVAVISGQVSPEVPDATAACRAMGGHITDLAAAYTDLATACTEYAGHLDDAHSDVEHELISLIEWTAGIEAGGAILGVLTVGIGEAAAQAAEAARIAATASRVAAIISRLIELVGTATETITAAATRVVAISQKLKALLGARISKIVADAVAKLPGTGRAVKDAEEVAQEGLATAAGALSEAEESAVAYASTPAKLEHIFAAKHKFDPLVTQFGSEEAVIREFVAGVRGLTPAAGTFQIEIQVGGQAVVVRGAVVNGVVKIGTAFTP